MAKVKSSHYTQAMRNVFNSLRAKTDSEIQSLLYSYAQSDVTQLLMGYAQANEQSVSVEAVALSFSSPTNNDIGRVVLSSPSLTQTSSKSALDVKESNIDITTDGNSIWTLLAA